MKMAHQRSVDPKAKFKKHFDKEQEQEKAYATRSEGNFDEENMKAPESLDGKPMPLNKYIAHCDICSRRDAVVLIKEGKVTVNGELITEPGHKVTLKILLPSMVRNWWCRRTWCIS